VTDLAVLAKVAEEIAVFIVPTAMKIQSLRSDIAVLLFHLEFV
jgi:hypothetical protein